MSFFLLYLVVGAVAGVLAGLLGIGGGLVIVPMLTFAFTAQGLAHEHILHLALGTSLASILFTSVSSLMAHHKRGAVLWPVVLAITPGILAGTFFGAWIASRLSTNFLKGFFGIFLYYVATQMIMGIKPKPTREIPGTVGIFGAGSVIGIFPAWWALAGGPFRFPSCPGAIPKSTRPLEPLPPLAFPLPWPGAWGILSTGWGWTTCPLFVWDM